MELVSENADAQATDILHLLSSCKPYSQQRNALPAEHVADRMVAWLFKSMGFAFACILGFGLASWVPRWNAGMVALAQWSFDALTVFGVLAALVYPGLFWVRRKHHADDRLHHVAGAFHHQARQVASLAAFPLPLLKKVERFSSARPLGVQGAFAGVFGEGALTIPGAAGLATIAKGISDLFGVHAGAVWAPVGAALWTVLGIVVVAVVVSRGVSGTARYQSRLLADAIADASEKAVAGVSSGSADREVSPEPSAPPTLQIVSDVVSKVGPAGVGSSRT
jgi:hypothetical protein